MPASTAVNSRFHWRRVCFQAQGCVSKPTHVGVGRIELLPGCRTEGLDSLGNSEATYQRDSSSGFPFFIEPDQSFETPFFWRILLSLSSSDWRKFSHYSFLSSDVCCWFLSPIAFTDLPWSEESPHYHTRIILFHSELYVKGYSKPISKQFLHTNFLHSLS